MLQRVVLGQARFNLPGLVADARGVVVGRQLVARFAAIDRLVAFLRVLSAEQSIDDLQPGLRIVYARGGAGTREAIVLMPVGSPGLADVVAQAAAWRGGRRSPERASSSSSTRTRVLRSATTSPCSPTRPGI